MNLVNFLEARIAERERAVLITRAPPSLIQALLAECAQERQILAAWKQAAEAEGITDPDQAAGTMAVASSFMLSLLAAGYKDHPEHMQRGVPTARPGPASTDESTERQSQQV